MLSEHEALSSILISDPQKDLMEGLVAHTFYCSIWGGRGRQISKFRASLVSFRKARESQRNPVFKKMK